MRTTAATTAGARAGAAAGARDDAKADAQADARAGAAERRPRIAYFVHELQDAAVLRRVQMLQAGGAEVVVLGFSRAATHPPSLAGASVQVLGQTRPGKFVSRIAAVIGAIAAWRRWLPAMSGTDTVIARNLECLAVAAFARTRRHGLKRLHYEVLDIHRLMLRDDLIGRALRLLEARLMRRVATILVSSPAFVTQYFARFHGATATRCTLIENKVFPIALAAAPPAAASRGDGPIVIGWFGVLRCRRSLLLLGKLTQRHPGRYSVVIRGNVAETAIPDFHALLQGMPGLRYLGPYRYPDDLASIYGSIDLAWAIDFFEQGMNSSWLLPNRLYESGLHGTVALALQGVQTGQWLRARGLGLTLAGQSDDDLIDAVAAISRQRIAALQQTLRAAPRSLFGADRRECAALVEALAA
jgi:succinoglycan biosynthesis protein ExoL